MKTIFEFGGANPFEKSVVPSMITVDQMESGKQLFRVTYGLQVRDGLTYSQACTEIGQCILHFQCCEGIASGA